MTYKPWWEIDNVLNQYGFYMENCADGYGFSTVSDISSPGCGWSDGDGGMRYGTE